MNVCMSVMLWDANFMDRAPGTYMQLRHYCLVVRGIPVAAARMSLSTSTRVLKCVMDESTSERDTEERDQRRRLLGQEVSLMSQ